MVILRTILLGALLGCVAGFAIGAALAPHAGGMHELQEAASGFVGAVIGAFVGATAGLAVVWVRRARDGPRSAPPS